MTSCFDGDGRTDRASLQIEVTAFDEWNCRADVACVGADLRVRPQNRLHSNEDGRTHRSAPTVEASTPPSGSPEEKSTEFPKREKLRILLAYELRKQDDVGGRCVGMTGTDAQIVRPYRTKWVDDVWESLFPDTVPYRHVVGLNYCNEPALICRTTISVPLDSEHSTKWGRL